MAIITTLTVAALAATVAARGNCTSPSQRRAWHTLSAADKKGYIDAELCLMRAAPVIGLPAARTAFDDLQGQHQVQAAWTHSVGAFLLYHRYFMHAHEHLLHTLCGYNGSQPYWEETLDSGHFANATIFDPVTGFGGDGRDGDHCITDGPFANYTNCYGPSYEISDHCIDRNISDSYSVMTAQAEVDACQAKDNFVDAWQCFEQTPHAGGHEGVALGYEMGNAISSPGDPIFYLHHTWLDKIFWDWQALNLSTRLTEIGGQNLQTSGFTESDGTTGVCLGNNTDGECNNSVTVSAGDPGNETTLGHVLSTIGIIPNVTVGDVMDIQGGYLCYEYVDST